MHAHTHTRINMVTNERPWYNVYDVCAYIQPHAPQPPPPPPAVRTSTAVTLLWWLPICIIRACACTYMCISPRYLLLLLLYCRCCHSFFVVVPTQPPPPYLLEECVVAITFRCRRRRRRPVALRFTIYYFIIIIIIYIHRIYVHVCVCDDEFVITHCGSRVKTIPVRGRRSHVLRYRYALATRGIACVCEPPYPIRLPSPL